jgi:hypothetical protein
MAVSRKHVGSSLDDFLKEQGLYDEVNLSLINALQKQGKKAAATKASARAFLIRAGIYDKTGKLASPYK